MFEPLPFRPAVVGGLLAGLLAASGPAVAAGGPGCPNLPEYDRAVGTIENGDYSCGMNTAEAQRILGRGAPAASGQRSAPPVRARRRHRHAPAPPM